MARHSQKSGCCLISFCHAYIIIQTLPSPSNPLLPCSYLAFVESALVNDTLPDTANNSTLLAVAGRGSWRALVDEAAFIDYMLILELTKVSWRVLLRNLYISARQWVGPLGTMGIGCNMRLGQLGCWQYD